jgi:hypothetical protein
VQVNRFARIGVARVVEQKRDAPIVEMRIESRGSLESSGVELLRIFEHDLGLVWNGLAHVICLRGKADANSLDRKNGGQYDLDQFESRAAKCICEVVRHRMGRDVITPQDEVVKEELEVQEQGESSQ